MLDVVRGLQLLDSGEEDGRGWTVKWNLTELADSEETLRTEYAGPACVWGWEVTRSRDESVVVIRSNRQRAN